MSTSYPNPLHAPVHKSKYSSYSSISSPHHSPAPSSSSSSSSPGSSPPRSNSNARTTLVPQQIPALSKRAAFINSHRSVSEPATPLAVTQRVAFDPAGGYAGQGMRVCEVINRPPHILETMIVGGRDQVGGLMMPAGYKKGACPSVRFQICWPGYPHVESTRTVTLVNPANGRPVNRAQLASSVAQHIARFVSHAALVPQKIESPNDAPWAISSGGRKGLGLNSVVLVGMEQVYEGVWMASIWV